MASYNAKIELQLAVNRALQKLQKVERALEKAASMAGIEVKVKGVERIERAVQNTNEGAQKLAKTFQDIENKALSKLPVSLQTVIAYLKAASSVATDFAKSTALAMAGVGQGIDKTIRATSEYTTEIVKAVEAMERLSDEQARVSRQERLAGSRGSASLNALLRSRMAQRAEIAPFGSPEATAEYERLSRQIIQLRGAINVQLRQQEMIENKILGYQREQAEAVRRNVDASKEAREAAGKGFAQFSQSIDTYLSKAKQLEREVSEAGGFRKWDEKIKRAFAQYVDALNEIKNLERRNALEQTELEIKLSDTELKKDLENERVLKQQKEKNLQDLADFDTRLANRVRRKEELQELGRRRRRALGEAAIGGAFPLLFGGGPGAAVGGSVGGLLGGLAGGQFGLALSLLGSQIGTAVDGIVTKAGDLGKALNTLTGDFEVILDSLGVSGTQTEQLIKALAELEGKNAALEESTRRLALVVGDDGVKALTDFGLYSTDFNNAVTQLTTILLSEAAKIINFIGRFVPFAQQTIRRAEVEAALRTDDPRLKEAQEEVRRAGFASTRIPAEDKLLGVYRTITEEQNEQLKDRVYSQRMVEDETGVLKIQGKILKLNADLKNKERQELERSLIVEKDRVARSKIQRQFNRGQIDFLKYSNELAKQQLKFNNANLELDNAIAKAFEKKGKGSKKVRDYTKDIAREEARQFQLQQQIAQVGVDRVTQIDIQLKGLKQRETLERAFIISSTKDTGLQNAKLETLRLIIALEEKRLTTAKQQIQIQRQIAELSRSQELRNLRRGLEQEIERGQLPTGDPFRDPFINLEREQRFRRADVFAGLDQQRDRLRIQRSIPGVDTGEIDKQLKNIEDQRAAYESLLPSIEANQKAQLLYNQALSQVQGPVNSLVNGFRDVVAGTKSAQEAFADFLNTIADQLIQTAATMIAQYIAIGIARAFALGGTPTPPSLNLSGVQQYSGVGADSFVPLPRANGGPVSTGRPYMVGERGPELFVPRSSGTIVPNDKMGGGTSNVVVNVDATGSKVEGDNNQASQLGKVIGAAVQAELVKQKRPGGLLAGV